MKHVFSFFLMLLFSASFFAQGEHPFRKPMTGPTLSQQNAQFYPGSRSDQFYHRNGIMRLQVGDEFIGSSVAFFTRGSNRFQYGMNMNMFTVSTGQRLLDDYYRTTVSESALLIPFWLSLKIRLHSGDSGNLYPYIITGLGPALGLKFNNASGVLNSLTHIETEFGGGAFVGIGMDYIWSEDWAFSADVRYNYVRFNNPLGLSDEYKGVSFAVGFIRAFGR